MPYKLSTLCESLVRLYPVCFFCTFYGNAPNRVKVSNYYFPQSLLSPPNLAKNFVQLARNPCLKGKMFSQIEKA